MQALLDTAIKTLLPHAMAAIGSMFAERKKTDINSRYWTFSGTDPTKPPPSADLAPERVKYSVWYKHVSRDHSAQSETPNEVTVNGYVVFKDTFREVTLKKLWPEYTFFTTNSLSEWDVCDRYKDGREEEFTETGTMPNKKRKKESETAESAPKRAKQNVSHMDDLIQVKSAVLEYKQKKLRQEAIEHFDICPQSMFECDTCMALLK